MGTMTSKNTNTKEAQLNQIMSTMSLENIEKAQASVQARAKAATLGPNQIKHVIEGPDLPDDPPCDGCGKDFSGKFACARCSLVFYCSRDCQKKHWSTNFGSTGGFHKRHCDAMKELSEKAAKRFVEALQNPKFGIMQKLPTEMWISVDALGPYNIALSLGLNEALTSLLKEDTDTASKRFHQTNIFACYAQHINCILFRGGRCNPGFSYVDPYRIKKFVNSSPNAFETWFEAGITIINIYLTSGMMALKGRNEAYYWRTQKLASDMSGAWSLVWTSSKASKTIILGRGKADDDATIERAKWTFRKCKVVLHQLLNLDQEGLDEGSVESEINTMVALYELQLKKCGVDIGDFGKMLGIKGQNLTMYEGIAHEFAKAQIKKGRALSTEESQKVTVEYMMNRDKSKDCVANPTKMGGRGKRKSRRNNALLRNIKI